MKHGLLIPVYNHGKPALEETGYLLSYQLPIILVDDGSREETKEYLKKAAQLSPLVTVITLPVNSGKGGALKAGFAKAYEMGLDDVLQIDADGQHDMKRIPHFLHLAEKNPGFLICGYPEYDESAPESRAKGRGVANFFTHLYTFSRTAIHDSMCGFRVYPVKESYQITQKGFWDFRMGFDIEILIRLYFHRVRILNESVKVTYPKDGTSNFHMVRDNIRISMVFTKLFFMIPFHIPAILYQKRFQ